LTVAENLWYDQVNENLLIAKATGSVIWQYEVLLPGII
jgi:hypothetical protein